jgi:hypothetical protein
LGGFRTPAHPRTGHLRWPVSENLHQKCATELWHQKSAFEMQAKTPE